MKKHENKNKTSTFCAVRYLDKKYSRNLNLPSSVLVADPPFIVHPEGDDDPFKVTWVFAQDTAAQPVEPGRILATSHDLEKPHEIGPCAFILVKLIYHDRLVWSGFDKTRGLGSPRGVQYTS
ncbi:uncharacterized protein TRUGW13939_10511 [Talaromyces rugulosus]|uniref:Uncharacterized protein n=1 Tax=Talaromyces rugulosus TaxID=121627 RepID=A0A7H8RC61_TALRU|nr:uncharacterized protein TRUGW13939_10511 [Talaromyces rugulosus]QKX63341.1 hypothetical protein TRUGW13939_10511 [Talaromyces rugulosus]